ncbi:MAG: glutamate 5-kinase [Clostridia bacterium]|nr:glutamate 5-kinase [Clostridia bacterium]
MHTFKNCQRLVIKVGTSTLTYKNGLVNIRRLEQLCKVLADIKNSGKDVILVTSGAIGVGAGKLGLSTRPKTIGAKQAAAAVGQCELMYMYDKLFSDYGHIISQVLLTRDGIEDPIRRANIVSALSELLKVGSIPIINENDTVSTEEIEFGDNDTLSAMVAVLAEADGLIILSDIDGLFDNNPTKDPHAKLIPLVHTIDEKLFSLADGSTSNRGTGGMTTKLHAAKIVLESGIPMVITNGTSPEKIYDILNGQAVGTLFTKEESV